MDTSTFLFYSSRLSKFLPLRTKLTCLRVKEASFWRTERGLRRRAFFLNRIKQFLPKSRAFSENEGKLSPCRTITCTPSLPMWVCVIRMCAIIREEMLRCVYAIFSQPKSDKYRPKNEERRKSQGLAASQGLLANFWRSVWAPGRATF